MRGIKEAVYVCDYKLKIRFDNGESKVVDLQDHIEGPVFEPLKNIGYFKSFYINNDIDTIAWPNNADFSPDFLYEIGQKVSDHDTSSNAHNRQS